MIPTLRIGGEYPGLGLFWLDTLDGAVDLSDGYSFTATIEQAGTEVALSANFTGNSSPTADTGSSNDVPTLALTFAAGALDSLSAGPAIIRVVATKAGRDRRQSWTALVDR